MSEVCNYFNELQRTVCPSGYARDAKNDEVPIAVRNSPRIWAKLPRDERDPITRSLLDSDDSFSFRPSGGRAQCIRFVFCVIVATASRAQCAFADKALHEKGLVGAPGAPETAHAAIPMSNVLRMKLLTFGRYIGLFSNYRASTSRMTSLSEKRERKNKKYELSFHVRKRFRNKYSNSLYASDETQRIDIVSRDV